jgi:hypothetical protein
MEPYLRLKIRLIELDEYTQRAEPVARASFIADTLLIT